MSAHTPTPWTFERQNKDSEDAGWQGAIKGPGGVEVCSFGDSTQYYPTEGCPPDEGDGEFLIRAVNAHDDLVSALNNPALLELLGNIEDSGSPEAARLFALVQAWEVAREAALAKAEGR